MDLAVGMQCWTSARQGWGPVKRARGAAGAQDLVRCAMGIRTGKPVSDELGSCLGTIAALGGGSIGTLGAGESSKVMQCGVAWKFGGGDNDDRRLGANDSFGDGLSGKVRYG